MKIFTYYEDIVGLEDPDLLGLWKESWAKYGFQPKVLGRRDAAHHPDYEFFMQCPYFGMYSSNYIYDRICFVRWLAVHNQGGGLASDWDVINYGVTPDQFKNITPEKGGLIFFNGIPIPSLVYGESDGYKGLIESFKKCGMSRTPLTNSPVSDMHVIRDFHDNIISMDWVKNYGSNGWDECDLVHYAGSHVKGHRVNSSRADFIQGVRPV